MVEVLVKKLLIILFLALVFLLVGCEQDLREIENVTLTEKKDVSEGRYSNYVFILEKDGQSVQLFVNTQNQYNSFFEGTIVDIVYDADDYYIKDIKIVKLEKEVKEDE